jgi:CheY-like chemotaxis protein
LPDDTVLASDGFFPFPDNVEVAARHGIGAMVQPGGSVKDDLVIETADRLVEAPDADPIAEVEIDETVDIVFLDRRMPEMTGDEVLSELRQLGYDTDVVMLTGVVPDVDIVDMPFDDYVKKPIDTDVLSRKIEVLTNRAEFEEMSRRLYSLASKKASLEATGMNEMNSEEYQQLTERLSAAERIALCCGCVRNELFCRLLADATDRPVTAGPVEATDVGNVLTQAVAVGTLASVEAGRRLVADAFALSTYEPSDSEGWERARERMRELPTDA